MYQIPEMCSWSRAKEVKLENFRVTGFQNDDNNLTVAVAGAVAVKAVPVVAVLALPPPGAADAIWFGRVFTWTESTILYYVCVQVASSQEIMPSNLFVA